MTHSPNPQEAIRIEEWRPQTFRPDLDAESAMLAEVLHAVVHAGAGVSFFTPFSIEEARQFWIDKILPEQHAGRRRILLARLNDRVSRNDKTQDGTDNAEEFNGRIVGTVQLELEMPPNQQHRAAVAKLLVHPTARRRGVARALMIALEEVARRERRTLLTLDTVTASSAQRLYTSLGFIVAGVIPRYARGALTPELESTTIMYKELPPTE